MMAILRETTHRALWAQRNPAEICCAHRAPPVHPEVSQNIGWLKCAIEEFVAFLIQFLGGDEEHTPAPLVAQFARIPRPNN